MGSAAAAIPIGKGGGIGLVIVLIVLAVCVAPRLGGDGGGDLGDILGGDPFSGFGQAQPGDTTTPLDPDDKLFGFVNAVVEDVNITWTDIFAESDQRYEEATTVVFEDSTSTGCGRGSAATGPFYCPADSQIYIDLSFFRELRDRFGAPGDFAQAYVIAHEYGHHVQNLLGINAEVQRMSQQDPGEPTTCRCGWSCRPTASPACGATPRWPGRAERGRPRGSARGRRVDRRRPHPGDDDGTHRPRELDPRLLGPAREVVPRRDSNGRSSELRHVRYRRAMTAPVRHDGGGGRSA